MIDQMKLYGVWSSPFSRRVELSLKLKGVPHEYFEENLQNKSSLLLKYNPVHKKIHVLVHNEKPVAEYLIILEYVDETWKNNPILPQDPYQKAMARFWAKFIDEKVWPTGIKANFADEKKRLKLIEEFFTEEKYPLLFKWIERLKGIDVVEETIPPRDKHPAYVKARFEAMKLGSAPN